MIDPRKVALTLLLAAGCTKSPPAQPPASTLPPGTPERPPPEIVMTQGGVLTIGETDVPPSLTTDLVESLFGPPDRVVEAGEQLWVYDELGMIAYHRRETDQILDLLLVFGPHDWEFQPAHDFATALTIAGVSIDGSTTQAELAAALPTPSDGYRYSYNYGEFEPTLNFGDDGTLSDVSLGFDVGDAYE